MNDAAMLRLCASALRHLPPEKKTQHLARWCDEKADLLDSSGVSVYESRQQFCGHTTPRDIERRAPPTLSDQ